MKLILPFTRFTYYAYALTDYPGGRLVLTGRVIGLAEDEVGDIAPRDIAELRGAHLPPERDQHWRPAALSRVSTNART